MTICKFFLNGNCRYGDSCRFEHADFSYSQGYRPQYRDGGGRGDPRRNDNYHWQKGGGGGGGNTSDVLRFAQAIRETVIIVENGNMWPLTCLAPVPQNGNFKGWVDYSPEELRYEFLKAVQTNTVDNYDKIVRTLYDSYREKGRKLKSMNQEMLEEVREYLKSTPEIDMSPSINPSSVFDSSSSLFGSSGVGQSFSFASAFTNTPAQSQDPATNFSFSQAFSGQPGSSIFGGQASATGSIFGGQSSQSVFGQNQQTSVFGQNQPLQQTSVFGGSQPSQQSSVFDQSQPSQQSSVFDQSQPSQPMFGQNQNSVFGSSVTPSTQSVFGNSFVSSNSQETGFQSSGSTFPSGTNFQQGAAGSIFGQTALQSSEPLQQSFPSNTQASNFGNATTNQNSVFSSNVNAFPSMPSAPSASSAVYSPLDSLSQEEIAAFEAQTFSLKKIPLSAPPESMCR